MFLESQTQLQSNIQSCIQETSKEIYANKSNWVKTAQKDPSDLSDSSPLDQMFIIDKKFNSLFSTIALFIKQEPFSNVSMNLNANFRCVQQENYTKIKVDGSTIQDAIFKENGKTFQNSPIHLMFYEKVNNADLPDDNTLDEKPQLSSLS